MTHARLIESGMFGINIRQDRLDLLMASSDIEALLRIQQHAGEPASDHTPDPVLDCRLCEQCEEWLDLFAHSVSNTRFRPGFFSPVRSPESDTRRTG